MSTGPTRTRCKDFLALEVSVSTETMINITAYIVSCLKTGRQFGESCMALTFQTRYCLTVSLLWEKFERHLPITSRTGMHQLGNGAVGRVVTRI